MADRFERVQIFEDTMKLCRQHTLLSQLISDSIKGQKIVWQEDPLFTCAPRYAEPAKLILSHHRTYEAARKYANQNKKVCALNFASSVTPGGGVTRGASAQEESMCRISTLYAAITDKETVGAFYDRHWQLINNGVMGRENRDDCIFTPGIEVIKEDTFDCALLPESEWYNVDVVTCAAPDLRFVPFGKTYRPTEEELTTVFENRWRRILSVAAEQETEVLILGAFGCGAFQNPPAVVVNTFNNVISEFACCFEVIEFAVFTNDYESENYRAFRGIKGISE